jgi:hypothetical protein
MTIKFDINTQSFAGQIYKSEFCLYGLSCVFPFLASYKTMIHATQDKSTTCAAELPVKGETPRLFNYSL